MILLKENRMAFQTVDYEKRRLDYAKANPLLSDEQVAVQFPTFSDVKKEIPSLIADINNKRFDTNEDEGIYLRAKSSAKRLTQIFENAPDLLEGLQTPERRNTFLGVLKEASQGDFTRMSAKTGESSKQPDFLEAFGASFEPSTGFGRDSATKQFMANTGRGGGAKSSFGYEGGERAYEGGGLIGGEAGISAAEGSKAAIDAARRQQVPSNFPPDASFDTQNPDKINYGGGQGLHRGSVTYGTGTPPPQGQSSLLPPNQPTPPRPKTPSTPPSGVGGGTGGTKAPPPLKRPNLPIDIQNTNAELLQWSEQVKATNPSLYAAILPSVANITDRLSKISGQTQRLMDALPDTEGLDEDANAEIARLTARETEENEIAEENKRLRLEVAESARQVAEIDKKMIEVDKAKAIQDQEALNVETQIQTVNGLAALGIESSTGGLELMRKTLQSGQDAVTNIMTKSNLLLLKASIPLVRGYQIDVADALNKHRTERGLIKKETDDAIATVQKNKASSEADILKELRSIFEKEDTKYDNLAKETASLMEKKEQTMYDRVKTERDDLQTQEKEAKDDAYQMFNFAFTNSTDPKMRKSAVEAMRVAGYELPDMDYSQMTPDQQIKMLDLAAKQKSASQSLNPSDYEGEAKNVAMMSANVLLSFTDSDKAVFNQHQAPMIASLLKEGKVEEAKKVIFDASVTNLSTSRKDVADRRAMLSWTDHTIQKLEAAKSLPGFYTTQWNDAKRFFGSQKDPEFRDLASVVALASVESLHELYGSALTANELDTARTILPLKRSNMNDAIQLLKNFRDWQMNKQTEIVESISGGGAFKKTSSPPSSSTIPTNDGMRGVLGGTAPVSFETSEINGKKVTARSSVIAALQLADEEMRAETGEGMDINSSFRSTEAQQAAYDRFLRGEIALAAKPGTSLHEKGLALDVTNWKKAEKYLKKHGFNPLPENLRSSDPAHFSFIYTG